MSLWTADGQEAVYAICGWDPDSRRLEVGQVEVAKGEYKRRGYATELVQRLAAAHPGIALSQSPQSNSAEGELWLAAVRAGGAAVHDRRCFQGDEGCACPCSPEPQERPRPR